MQFTFQSKLFFVFLVEKFGAVMGAGCVCVCVCAGSNISPQTRTNCSGFYTEAGESLEAELVVSFWKGKETA
jgi:hypothetical protein